MADSIVRLRVENSEYDAKIKRAAQGILHLEDAAKKSGRSLDTLTKEEKDFVSSLGKMETVSKDARGRVNELSKAFVDLSVQYNHLTDEAKKGEFGKELAKQLEVLKQRATEARKELNDINGSIGNVSVPNMGGFDLKGMAGGAMKFAGSLGIAVSSVALFKDAIKNNVQTAMEFEDSISKLSSLTGLVGDDLGKLKGYAIELGGSTTQSASQVAQAFMLIGSQKPELLKDSEALRDVTKAAITLGEAANIDVTEAAKALTASLNIMGEGADQANRYINVLAAGSKEGSVDIAGLTEIVFKAGQAATMNKLPFEQLIAVAELIGSSFGSSAEAGTALNAMLLKLETQTNNQFKPSVVGLQTALKNLKEANLSAADATKLVTETGYKALVPLLQNVEGVGKLQNAITGTTTAEDQANTNTNNLKGSLAALDSAWERFNLTLNDSNTALKSAVDWLTDMVNWMSDLATKTDIASEALKRFNEQNGGGDGEKSFKDEKTRGQQIGAYNKRKKALDAEIAKRQENLNSYQRRMNDESLSDVVRNQQKALYEGTKKALDALKAERDKLIAEGKKFFYGGGSSSTTTTTTTPTTTTTTPKATGNSNLRDIRTLGDVQGFTRDEIIMSWRMPSIQELQNLIKMRTQELNSTDDTFRRIEIRAEIDDLKDQLAELTADPLKINIVFPEGSTLTKEGDDAAKAWEKASSAIGTVGSALQMINDPSAKVFGIIAEAVANIAGTFAASLKGTFTPWDWIAAAASGTATMISTIAAIKSATAEYHAGGGIVGQGAFIPRGTDTVPAMLTPGEVVLSAGQSANVAQQLQNGSQRGGWQGQPFVQSELIYLGINNHLKRTGQGEIITSQNINKYLH